MEGSPGPDPRLAVEAIRRYRDALVEYEAGLLADAELRRALIEAATVDEAHGRWILSVDEGRWFHFDGVRIE